MSARNLQTELMDEPTLDEQVHRQALAGLARINSVSRSAALSWSGIAHIAATQHLRTIRVLDVASGAGDVALGLWRKAARAGVDLELVGVDISPTAVAVARERACKAHADISFQVCDALNDPLDGPYDIVTSSLFLHHLSESQAIGLLTRLAEVSRYGIVVNDLHRSRTGIALAHLACRLLSRSAIVHADGPQSVAGAFTVAEMRSLFSRATLASVRIRKSWPARQLAVWSRTG